MRFISSKSVKRRDIISPTTKEKERPNIGFQRRFEGKGMTVAGGTNKTRASVNIRYETEKMLRILWIQDVILVGTSHPSSCPSVGTCMVILISPFILMGCSYFSLLDQGGKAVREYQTSSRPKTPYKTSFVDLLQNAE